jgi:MFS family permease
VVLALATAGLAAASSLPMVAVLRSAQGFLAASFSTVALAYVGEALPPRWRPTGIGAMSTAFLSAGILGQVYAQAVADALSWRWVFGLAAPAFVVGAIAIVTVLLEPPRKGGSVSLGEKFKELAAMAIRRELTLINAAAFPVILTFVAMYAALGPVLQAQFGLDDTSVLYVRLAGLPAMLLAPLAGWLVGRQGGTRVDCAFSDRDGRQPWRQIPGRSPLPQRVVRVRRSLVWPADSPAADWVHRPDARPGRAAVDSGRTRRDQQSSRGRRQSLRVVDQSPSELFTPVG